MELADFDDRGLDAGVAAADFGDAIGKAFEQLMTLGRDDPTHCFAYRAVVHCVVECVARSRGAEIDTQFDVDLERLRAVLLLGQHAVHTERPDTNDPDAIHTVSLALSAARGYRCRPYGPFARSLGADSFFGRLHHTGLFTH